MVSFLLDFPPITIRIPLLAYLSLHALPIPCHHNMVRPQVADGGNSLKLWTVAASIMNKQSRLGVGLTTTHLKKRLVTKCLKGPSTWMDSLE
jgi:hypothetical protein